MVDRSLCIVDVLVNNKSRPSSIFSRAPAKREEHEEILLGATKAEEEQTIAKSAFGSRLEVVNVKAPPSAICNKPVYGNRIEPFAVNEVCRPLHPTKTSYRGKKVCKRTSKPPRFIALIDPSSRARPRFWCSVCSCKREGCGQV